MVLVFIVPLIPATEQSSFQPSAPRQSHSVGKRTCQHRPDAGPPRNRLETLILKNDFCLFEL
jgi:hypothetical protein